MIYIKLYKSPEDAANRSIPTPNAVKLKDVNGTTIVKRNVYDVKTDQNGDTYKVELPIKISANASGKLAVNYGCNVYKMVVSCPDEEGYSGVYYYSELDNIVKSTVTKYAFISDDGTCILYTRILGEITYTYTKGEDSNLQCLMKTSTSYWTSESYTYTIYPPVLSTSKYEIIDYEEGNNQIVYAHSDISNICTKYNGNTTITFIELPIGTREIPSAAYLSCGSLTDITIPNTVERIGAGAFADCAEITTINIPASVTKIGSEIFVGTSVTSVTIDPDNEFYTDEGLDCIIETQTNTLIYGGYSWTSLPSQISYITRIAISAFAYQPCLLTLILPQSVTYIGDSAFSDCDSLLSCTGNGETSDGNGNLYIDNRAFGGSTPLESATFNNYETLTICSHALYIPAALADLQFNNVSSITIGNNGIRGTFSELIIPNNHIQTLASDNYSLDELSETHVDIQTAGVSLEKLIINGNCTLHERFCSVVASTTYLLTLIINGDLTIDGNNALSEQTLLHTIKYNSINPPTFINNDPDLSPWAESGNTCMGYLYRNLDNVIMIPATATYTDEELLGTNWANIGSNTSGGGYTIVRSPLLLGGVPPENEIWFTTTDNSDVLPYVTTISTRSFIDERNIDDLNVKRMIFNGKITSIDTNAFLQKTTLKMVAFSPAVTSIGYAAFYNCRGLLTVILPDYNITSIGQGAFQNCQSLTNIVIPSSITSIGQSAFDGCTNLSITIPDDSKITSVPTTAFNNVNMLLLYMSWYTSLDSTDGFPWGAQHIQITYRVALN